jgi:muramoyltetrapeptide carboxypeptidase LdcA involved in peptidoglycan recycling
MDGVFEDEYKRLLRDILEPLGLPVVFGINAENALPRCIIPFGVDAEVDALEQAIRFSQQ